MPVKSSNPFLYLADLSTLLAQDVLQSQLLLTGLPCDVSPT